MHPAFQISLESAGTKPGNPQAGLDGRVIQEETNHSSPGVGQEMPIGCSPQGEGDVPAG